jgi:hypothetical protein
LTAAFGGPAGNLPDETGMWVPKNSRFILEVHYNTFTSGRPHADRPQIFVKSRKKVKHPGQLLVWQPGESELHVPADGKQTVAYQESPQKFLARAQPQIFSVAEPLKVHFMTMHMHDVGVSTALTVEGGGSSPRLLVRIPKWQTMMQVYDLILKDPVLIQPGQELKLSCMYDNTTANPRRPLKDGKSVGVKWGWDWDKEMCMGFIYVSAV